MGYFPTYTLGNLRSAQLFDQASVEIPDLSTKINGGQFAPLKNWLKEKIHQHGRMHDGDTLMQMATGSKTSSVPFVNYLKTKYGALYGIDL